MPLKEYIENHPFRFIGTAFLAGCGCVYTFLSATQEKLDLKIHQNGNCKTTEEINKNYVPREQYKQQDIRLTDFREKYYKALAENNQLKSTEPMWAIQIDDAGYKTIEGKEDVWCGMMQASDNFLFNNSDVYEFDGYYYIFKYDKGRNKNQMQEEVRAIRNKHPELKCEIVDLRSFCQSQIFVEEECFSCGGNTYICKTCK